MDAIDHFAHDHRRLEQLMRDYRAATNEAQRRAAVESMVREISQHAALEELILYPMARAALPGHGVLIDSQLLGHAVIKQRLCGLDRLGSGDTREGRLVEALCSEVTEHIQSAEALLFPPLRRVATHRQLFQASGRLSRYRRVAPTRPHPHVPDEPPALAIVAPIVGAYDRLRDELAGRTSA